jgi:hypothetical protein
VDGHIDFDHFDNGFDMDMSANVRYDPEAIQGLTQDLQVMMQALQEELGASMSDLGDELGAMGDQMRQRARDRR